MINKNENRFVFIMLFLFVAAMFVESYSREYPIIISSGAHERNLLWFIAVFSLLLVFLPPILLLSESKAITAIQAIFWGLPAIFLTANFLAFCNGYFDRSAPSVAYAQIISKHLSKKGGSQSVQIRTSLYSENVFFPVSYQFYVLINKNDNIRFIYKNGAFGYRWVQSYEKLS